MKKRILASTLALAALLLAAAGCQPAPETSIVASKNDGALEAALEDKAASSEDEDTIVSEQSEYQSEAKVASIVYSDSFTSADGTISCEVNIAQPVLDTPLPVIQITPHEITSEEAEHIAGVLFGDAPVYEYSGNVMTKMELEETILALKEWIADRDTLIEYYGSEELANSIIAMYEAQIENYSQQYAAAPDENESILCDWEFHPDSYYEDTTMLEALGSDLTALDATMSIQGTVLYNGLEYRYNVSNRNNSDYRLHMIFAYAYSNGPDTDVYSTEEQNENDILYKAQELLEQMDIGEWEIISVNSYSDKNSYNETVYYTEIQADPVYCGVLVTYVPQIGNLKTGDAYASNYYYEQITMVYSGGELMSFMYLSPMDIVDVINDDVATLSFDEIMERFQKQMEFGVLDTSDGSIISEASTMAFDVTKVELGLVRTRIKNNETDFYLLPAYTFSGNYTCYDEDGKIIFASTDMGEDTTVLLTINAVDGSVINTKLGY